VREISSPTVTDRSQIRITGHVFGPLTPVPLPRFVGSPRHTVRPTLTNDDRSLLGAVTDGSSPPTHSFDDTDAASPNTGPNQPKNQEDHRPEPTSGVSSSRSRPRTRPGDTTASTANSPVSRPHPRSINHLEDPQTPRNPSGSTTFDGHIDPVPTIPSHRRLRLRHHRHQPDRALDHPSSPQPIPTPSQPIRRYPGART
jgi:hypothetical protein